MKKILFISNISNKITNFSLPSIYAAKNLGYEFHMAANYSNFNDDPEKYGVKLHHVDLDRNPFSKQNITAYKQMLELINKEKFDVIHCNTPIGGVLGRLCGKRAKVSKIIYTAHGFHFYKGAPLINRTFFKWAEMWLAKYTDVIIAINNEDYEAAKKFKLRNDGKVYYIPGVGIDTSIFKNTKSKREEVLKEIGANNDSIIVISIGELNKNKNNEVIIRSLGKLNNPKIHYILCGMGEKKDELCALSKELDLENNIHFLGYRTDISELLKSSDIFVMPSYREGLSRSLMEAMSAGLPCVVSDIRGNVDLIEDGVGGFVHKANDIGSFSKSIYTLTLNEELRKNMGIKNLDLVKKFDVSIVKSKLLSIYIEEFNHNGDDII